MVNITHQLGMDKRNQEQRLVRGCFHLSMRHLSLQCKVKVKEASVNIYPMILMRILWQAKAVYKVPSVVQNLLMLKNIKTNHLCVHKINHNSSINNNISKRGLLKRWKSKMTFSNHKINESQIQRKVRIT